MIIFALKLLAKCANSTRFIDKPGLTILRALEGIVLMYLESNQSQRKDVADFLYDVLRSRKLPPQALCRIETALWTLSTSPSLRCTPAREPRLRTGDAIDSDAGAALDQRLLKLLQSLRPSPDKRQRWEAGFAKVNAVLVECFGVEGKLFGSAVNGFELATSDLDVVVPLSQATIDALLKENDKRGSVQVTPKQADYSGPEFSAESEGDKPKASPESEAPGIQPTDGSDAAFQVSAEGLEGDETPKDETPKGGDETPFEFADVDAEEDTQEAGGGRGERPPAERS